MADNPDTTSVHSVEAALARITRYCHEEHPKICKCCWTRATISDLARENRNLQQQIDRLTLPYQEWWDKWHKHD
jgi:hypothetical protein